jgi:hypothetical protein
MGRDSNISLKRRISRISQGANQELVSSHKLVKMVKRGWCISYKGLRFIDRPKKRVILGEIIANQGRESTSHLSFYGYKQCDVYLYKKRACFEVFHREK